MPPMVVIQQIEASIEDVFKFVGHVETHPQIADFCSAVKITSEQKCGVGTRFHQVYADGTECDSVIMEWDPFEKIVWHNFEGGSMKACQIITYRFEQEGKISHVLHTVNTYSYENQALHRKGMQENMQEMENLKKVLEKTEMNEPPRIR